MRQLDDEFQPIGTREPSREMLGPVRFEGHGDPLHRREETHNLTSLDALARLTQDLHQLGTDQVDLGPCQDAAREVGAGLTFIGECHPDGRPEVAQDLVEFLRGPRVVQDLPRRTFCLEHGLLQDRQQRRREVRRHRNVRVPGFDPRSRWRRAAHRTGAR